MVGILLSGNFDRVHLESRWAVPVAAVIEAVSVGKALPPAKRQHRSREHKRKMVEEMLVPGAWVARQG